MIKKVIKQFRKVFIPKSEFIEGDVLVEITKEVNQPESSYVGVPAPTVLQNDPWFGSAPKTEKAIEYVQKKNEELYKRLAEEPKSKEPDNIHQVMYEMATKNFNTTTQLDPIGGSENFQNGPNGWNSGTGQNQFRS